MNSNRNTIIISVIVLIVIVLGGWYLINQSSAGTGTVATTTAATSSATAAGTTGAANTTTVTTTTHTTTSAPAQGTIAVAPQIISFTPAGGGVGTQVTIEGTNFSRTANYVMFGASDSRFRSDGTPDNQIAVVASTNGTSITFTVPASGPSGLLCNAQKQCIAVSAVATIPGNYPVTVRDSGGTSNVKDFTVLK